MQEYLKDIAAAFQNAPALRGRQRESDRTLKCPVCATDMAVERLHGIAIDVCRTHGMWFDVGEAQLLVRRVESGERASARQAVAEAKRSGKLSGMFLGLTSLFIDDD